MAREAQVLPRNYGGHVRSNDQAGQPATYQSIHPSLLAKTRPIAFRIFNFLVYSPLLIGEKSTNRHSDFQLFSLFTLGY
jgi:hypothetical protein